MAIKLMYVSTVLFLISLFGVSAHSFASPACKILGMDEYKNRIEMKEKADSLLRKLPKDAYWYPLEIKNCYVLITVRPNKNFIDYSVTYLFDPKGELVNVQPLGGASGMTCNGREKNGTDYFETLLAQRRATDLSLPRPLKNPKKTYALVFFCNVHFTETFQDDPAKPLLHRRWVFDQNGNIVEYSDVKRYSKIYKD